MGRSVNYLDNAEVVIYFTADWINFDDNGVILADIANMNWDDFEGNLCAEIIGKLKSYHSVNEWDNKETKIIVKNELCNIGISEYCGLYSLSVASIEYDGYYPEELAKLNFSKHHAQQIKNTLCKILKENGCKVLDKIGTFSSGEAVYELAK